MPLAFQKATKKQLKARIALLGPAGSGKSYTALRLAFALAGPEGKVAAIDTEHRSLSKYVGEAPDKIPWDFDVLELDSFSPENYIEGIRAAEQAGYSVLVIDSLSHAWSGKDGLLEFVDTTARKQAARSGGSPNNFNAWREATPKHNELVEAMLGSNIHLIVTMRVKMEYVQEKNPQTGKTEIRKVCLQPIQRDGLEYEFDVIGDMDADNNLLVSKSRCSRLMGKLIAKPGPAVVDTIREWLESGAPAPERAPKPEPERAPASQAQAWTSKRAYIDRLHGFIEQEAARLGLQFPIDGPESAYERIKGEQFGIAHLTEYTGSPEEFKAGIEAWFAAEVERQIADKPKEAA